MIEMKLIDYEPLAVELNLKDEDGYPAYHNGLPPFHFRNHYEVTKWCCQKLENSVAGWDGIIHIDTKVNWNKNIDTLIDNLLLTVGEWNSSKAELLSFSFCPFCRTGVEFKEVDRILKNPKLQPPDDIVVYMWFGPDEIPWWERNYKKEGDEK